MEEKQYEKPAPDKVPLPSTGEQGQSPPIPKPDQGNPADKPPMPTDGGQPAGEILCLNCVSKSSTPKS